MSRINADPDLSGAKLEKLKRKIDAVDRELIQMLEARIELSLRASKLMSKGLVSSLDYILERCSDMVSPDFVKKTFDQIVGESDRLQKENTKLVAFQGEHGAYGEVASRALVPGSAYIPCLEFADVFDGVEDGLFDLGVVPVENSLEGAVTQVNDLLTATPLKVVGEVKVPIHHALLAAPDTDPSSIRIVYSHPQALAQCRGYILKRRLEARPFYDTAGAARMLDRDRPLATAAIASSLCAKLYGLQILKEGIEDEDSNSTRFQILSRTPYDGIGEKCSIIFAVTHSAGSLQSVLQLFANAEINLTRIASTPRKSDPGNYTFFCDFEGSDKDPRIKGVLQQIERQAADFLFLGCYPAAEKGSDP